MSLAAVPSTVEPDAIRKFLERRSGVASVHDLHIWAMSTTENALTVHIVMPQGHPGDAFLARLCHDLDSCFGIKHPTFQIELGDAEDCLLAPAHLV